jgi:hypothetical protein
MDRRAASMAETAKHLSNPQDIQAMQQRLVTGVQNGSIQPYVAIPLIQQLTQRLTEAKAQAAKAAMGGGMPQGQGAAPSAPIAQQVMQQAEQSQGQGIPALSSNLPQSYAGGGIIAFEDGGEVDDGAQRFQVGGTAQVPQLSYDELMKLFRTDPALAKEAVTRAAAMGTPATSTAGFTPYRAGQLTGQAARSGLSGAGNLLSRGLVGTIGGPATLGIGALLTPSSLVDDQAALAALRGEGYRGQPYDVVSARKALEAAGLDPNKAPVQPATPVVAPYNPETATRRSDYTDKPYPTTGATRSGDDATGTGTGGTGIGSFKPPVLPTLTLPTAAPLTNYQDALKDAPKKAQDASEKAVKEAEEKYTNFDKPGEEAREKRFSTREAAQEKDSAINRALNLMNVGFGIAGSKERTTAGALGKEGREGIQNLIQGEAANRAAKNRLEDLRDNFEQQKTAAKKGNYQAAQAAGQRAADDARAYTQLNMQATHFGNTEANQRLQTEQQGKLGAAQLNQQGVLGLAGLDLQGRQLLNTTAYQNRSLDMMEKRYAAMDTAAKARMKQVQVGAFNKFNELVAPQINSQLTKEYGANWRTGQDPRSLEAQMKFKQQQNAYVLDALGQHDERTANLKDSTDL